MSSRPSLGIESRVAALMGSRAIEWRAVFGGYTPAARWIARFGTGTAFVKVATTPRTASMLRGEIAAYTTLSASFMPEYIASEDDAEAPILIVQDLSAAAWPPPWDRARVDDVLEAIERLHSTRAALPSYRPAHGDAPLGWREVERDSRPFLSLEIASERWLRESLPALMAAEAACSVDGDAPCHWDLRSDNLCFASDGVKIIDWAEACLSNPKLDTGFWLPSLAFEGGPLPDTILPDAPEVAAWVSGFFAARAGLPAIPDAPRVRQVQREQLETALPWAVRAVGLPDPADR